MMMLDLEGLSLKSEDNTTPCESTASDEGEAAARRLRWFPRVVSLLEVPTKFRDHSEPVWKSDFRHINTVAKSPRDLNRWFRKTHLAILYSLR